jgi:glucosamine--fructose-6-phosphate aminotransferase (isomerizing)
MMGEELTAMEEQVLSLPELVNESLPAFGASVRTLLRPALTRDLRQVYLVGCGDSHMAAVGAELAFHSLTGLPCHALTALHFSRYTAPFLAVADAHETLVIAISVSGEVARTVEALHMARRAGALTVALTGNAGSRLARAGEHLLYTRISARRNPAAAPGVRSYAASLLALYLAAVRLGEVHGYLNPAAAAAARNELHSVPEVQAAALRSNRERSRELAAACSDAREFVFLGGGPAYGVALYGAAKLFEASGDSADGQDIEEWAHLQYFARDVSTPTFIIDPQGRAYSRACEVAEAARAIGRRVVAVVPEGEASIAASATWVLPLPQGLREAFAPLILCLPLMCFASERARVLKESPYRGFGGGRSQLEGGGASRIQSSATEGAEVLP